MTGNHIIPLSFENQSIRVSDQDGNPWFVAADVCAALGIKNSRDAVARLDADERAEVALTDTSSNGVVQSRLTTVLSEAGVYTIALRCRDAMTAGTVPYKFRKWVTGTALPAIRRGNDAHAINLSQSDRSAIGGIVKGILHKEIAQIVPALVAEQVMSSRFSIVEGVCAVEVAEMAGYKAGMRPRGVSQFISRRLARFHEERGVPIRRDRRGIIKARLFDEATSRNWLSAGGKTEVDHYIAQRKGQGALRLVQS